MIKFSDLTHLPLVLHICVSELGQHIWRQAITRTNAKLLWNCSQVNVREHL